MPSPALLEAHRQELADITAVAQAELWEAWQRMPLDDADATRRALAASMTDLVETFGPLAAGSGVDWYREARAESVTGRFSAVLVTPLSPEQIDSNAGWAVGPLYGQPDTTTAFNRAGGSVQKLIVNADRQTVIVNTERDRRARRWYRGASAGCCTFCALLASRGAVYVSEGSASFKAHDFCRCFAAPQFDGDLGVPDYYDQFQQEYEDAVKAVDNLGERRTAKAILREMRARSGRA